MAMGGRFTHKKAIVTGGSKGIGLAIAERLAREGAEVLITARNVDDLRQAAAKIEGEGATVSVQDGDLADTEFCRSLIDGAAERWGQIDVLINNAGIFDEAGFLEIGLEGWRSVLDVMLQAPFLLTQRAAAVMVENGGGSVVSLSSIDGHGVDGPFTSYSVAKAGLMQLTKNIAVELGSKGVRANTVSPGWVLTDMAKAAMAPEELERMRHDFRRVPMQRMVTPEEVAAAVCFLASDEASGITGTDLVVDGGTIADLYILPTLAEPDAAAGDETAR